MLQTDNFELNIYEGEDLFNPLTVENENTNKIDEQMLKNQIACVQSATELFTDSIHAITRKVPDAPVFRFTAVSDYTAGDTFTVDDVQVSTFLTSGEALPTGAYRIGAEVIGILKGTRLTVFISSGAVAKAQDSDKLEGQPASYYAKQSDLENVEEVANASGELAQQATQEVAQLSQKVDNFSAKIFIDTSRVVQSGFVVGNNYTWDESQATTADDDCFVYCGSSNFGCAIFINGVQVSKILTSDTRGNNINSTGIYVKKGDKFLVTDYNSSNQHRWTAWGLK